jgi:hypothetical protein
VLGLSAPFRRVIWVYTRVGDVDRGVCHDKGTSSVDRAIGAAMVLGPPNMGAILRRAEVGLGLCTLKFIKLFLTNVR